MRLVPTICFILLLIVPVSSHAGQAGVLIKLKSGVKFKAEVCIQEGDVTEYTLPGSEKVYRISSDEIESVSSYSEAKPDQAAGDSEGNKMPSHRAKSKGGIIPSGTPESWALAVTAILTEFNSGRHDLLGGETSCSKNISDCKRILSRWWEVNSREDLLGVLAWLDNGGHRQEFDALGQRVANLGNKEFEELVRYQRNKETRSRLQIVRQYYDKFGPKSLVGWDYARYISLCRWGYLAGYLSEDEAWDYIMPAAARIQRAFDSWADFGNNYLVGRAFWSYEMTKENGEEYQRICRRLLSNSDSPWRRNRWNMNLH